MTDLRLSEVEEYLKEGRYPSGANQASKNSIRRRAKDFSIIEGELFYTRHLEKDQESKPRIVVMRVEEQQRLLHKLHQESGHRGRDYIYKILHETHYWKTLWTDAGNFVKSCPGCSKTEPTRSHPLAKKGPAPQEQLAAVETNPPSRACGETSSHPMAKKGPASTHKVTNTKLMCPAPTHKVTNTKLVCPAPTHKVTNTKLMQNAISCVGLAGDANKQRRLEAIQDSDMREKSQSDQECKDREGAAGRFADQEKQWMEQIKEANEERDHLKAVNTQLQEEIAALKHEVERVKKESHGIVDGLDKRLGFQENTIKKQEAANRKQESEHKKREAALQKHIERLNLEVAKLKADLKASNEDARRREVQTTGEIQALQEQYRVLSSDFAKMRDENERLRNRSANQTQIPQINREIENEGKKYKEGQQKGVPVSDDEKLRPYDPNLVCPHCGQRLRHGQIREYRYHIDDEHSPQ